MNYIGILGLIFVVAKLYGAVTWPWVVVLMPFWLSFVLFLAFWGFAFAAMLLAAVLK